MVHKSIPEIALEQLWRSWKTLQNEPLAAKSRFDTAGNEVSEVEIGDFDKLVMKKASSNIGFAILVLNCRDASFACPFVAQASVAASRVYFEPSNPPLTAASTNCFLGIFEKCLTRSQEISR